MVKNEMTIEALTENLDTVTEFIDTMLGNADCSMKVQMQIDIAVEELFVNIAKYAYAPNTGMATIRTEIIDNPKMVSITFIDEGIPYDPLAKEDPDVTLSSEKRKIGGLGIYMVKKSMDYIEYEYRDGRNILTIGKRC